MPTGELLWSLRGPHCVGLPSSWTQISNPVDRFGQGVATAAPHWSSSSMVVPPCLCNWLLREDRMSWIASSLHWGLQGSELGYLLSKYTSW